MGTKRFKQVTKSTFPQINEKLVSQPDWQEELRRAITDIAELYRILGLYGERVPPQADTDYPLFVPRPFVHLMEQGNANDPLLLQVLPREEENKQTEGFAEDPLEETEGTRKIRCEALSAQYDVLHKYHGRALILASNRCGVHCRFCFRRHTLRHPEVPLRCTPDSIEGNTVSFPPDVEEIILSGGDPLMLDDESLHGLLQSLIRIDRVKRIRIHSRLPVVLPNRLTPKLAEILDLPKPLYLVLHVNHPNELSDELLNRRERFIKPVVMTQTVLLKGINDDAETLLRLFTQLIDHRILPYYLHQLDRVAGAAHFEVPSERGCRILDELRDRLPGYAVPKYVRERSGWESKEAITKTLFR